jgi:hypothetical protein
MRDTPKAPEKQTQHAELTELRDALALEVVRAAFQHGGPGTTPEAMRFYRKIFEVTDAILAGRGNAGEVWYPPNRCQLCGWPLAATASSGCVPGNCGFRPGDHTSESARIQARREWIKAQPEGEAVLEGRLVKRRADTPAPLRHCPVCAGMAKASDQSHTMPSIEHPSLAVAGSGITTGRHCGLCADLPGHHPKHEPGTLEHPANSAPADLTLVCICPDEKVINTNCPIHGTAVMASLVARALDENVEGRA